MTDRTTRARPETNVAAIRLHPAHGRRAKDAAPTFINWA